MRPKKTVTIKDLAQELNVSPSTVSRALQDSHQISPATKLAVQQLAKDWNYRPNRLAQRLITRQSRSIGIVVPEISYYFNSEVIRGIEEVLVEKGFQLQISQTHESWKQEALHCENLLANQVAGIIASVSGEAKDLTHWYNIQAEGTPLVLFDRGFNIPKIPKVMIDNEAAAEAGIRHLIEIGRRRIAFLMGPAKMPICHARRKGYLRALQAAGLSTDPDLIQHTDFSVDMGFGAAQTLLRLRPRPDAIFTINDRIGIGALAAIRHSGLRVPEEVAVLGFNDEPYAALISPGLTTVAQPAYKMGQVAAHMLLQQMEDPATATSFKILPTQLIVRGSTVR
ncbi:MAG: LacI family DNA-binding transcriptional regulator, partial [Bacteroidota bacterium]